MTSRRLVPETTLSGVARGYEARPNASGTVYHAVLIGGTRVYTADAKLGPALQTLNGRKVSFTVTAERKPNVRELVGIQSVADRVSERAASPKHPPARLVMPTR